MICGAKIRAFRRKGFIVCFIGFRFCKNPHFIVVFDVPATITSVS